MTGGYTAYPYDEGVPKFQVRLGLGITLSFLVNRYYMDM